jgi:2-polyprenyl-3-methyl-5-hydroxy-6-metoxy-1,4-benzoquinol methylase
MAKAQYLVENNEFYSHEAVQQRLYSLPYPDEEEAARGAVVLGYLAAIHPLVAASDSTPTILDLGCGRGWLTALAALFGQSEGIDPAESAVRFGQTYYPSLRFRRATLSDLLTSDGFRPYDIIITSEVIEHVPLAHKDGFVMEIRQALKPNGFCIVTTPRGEVFQAYCRQQPFLQAVEAWSTEQELRQLFGKQGFAVVKHDRCFPMGVNLWGRLYTHPAAGGLLRLRRAGFLRRALDYLSSVYQVWCFRKID